MPSASATDPPNLLGFRLAHRAMRSDLHRLADLAARISDGTAVCESRQASVLARYLHRVCDGIHHHHEVEDRHLWPVIERAAGAGIDLTELSDDHATLEPLLDRTRQAVTRLAAAPRDRDAAQHLAYTLKALRDLLDEHIEDEERTILPIIERYVSVADWNLVERAAGKAGDPWFELPRIERFAHPHELAELYALAGPVFRVALAVLRPGYRRRERIIFG